MFKANSNFFDLPQRFLSAFIFALVGLLSLHSGGIIATAFLAVCLSVLGWEVFYIFSSGSVEVNLSTLIILVLLFFIPFLLFGELYILLVIFGTCLATFFIYRSDWLKFVCITYLCMSILLFQTMLLFGGMFAHTYYLLFLIGIVAASDIGGYFFGKLIGGAKILSTISPNKTWAGSIGGIILALILSFSFYPILNYSIFEICILGSILTISAQAGDFFESWLKRRFNVKDSGIILPGHGGLFDRLDGLLAAIPTYMIMSHIFIFFRG